MKASDELKLNPIFDGARLLQVFKNCKAGIKEARQCTSNADCPDFKYQIKDCSKKITDHEGIKNAHEKQKNVTCEKKKQGK